VSDAGERHLSYEDAGVSIDAGDAVVAGIRTLTQGKRHPNVLGGLGHFGGFYRLGAPGSETTLVASIDGVGTKLMIASLAGKLDTIGADLVNHCVNDILACGASPLFFLDYYGTGKLNPDAALRVIGGMVRACEDNGIALLGGETAEMPGLYDGDDFDLVGAIIGSVQESQIIDGSAIKNGDLLVGLPSDGFHTNGYSLVRAALGITDSDASRRRLAEPAPFDPSRSVADVLLQPHRSYRSVVQRVLAAQAVQGMAHITGGGLPGNVQRIVPDGMTAEIDPGAWTVPPVFDYVAEVGHIGLAECMRAFNMGIGFVLVCRPEHVETVRDIAPDLMVIGQIVAGSGGKVALAGIDLSD
jgi:phosphoribosylformylglycinamidine cyclo-ligase